MTLTYYPCLHFCTKRLNSSRRIREDVPQKSGLAGAGRTRNEDARTVLFTSGEGNL
jgi:hypothetical protein